MIGSIGSMGAYGQCGSCGGNCAGCQKVCTSKVDFSGAFGSYGVGAGAIAAVIAADDPWWWSRNARGKCVESKSQVVKWKTRIGKRLYPQAEAHLVKWKERRKQFCNAADYDPLGEENYAMDTGTSYEPADDASSSSGLLPLLFVGGGGAVLLYAIYAYYKR